MRNFHCAFCLNAIHDRVNVKFCGKCRRRPYCSKECQSLDWNNAIGGQKHKLWCGKEYGEEDEDWIICPVEYGLGIVALRDIPPYFPIIVERGLDGKDDHPGVNDLCPDGGSLQEKWDLNRMGTLVSKSVLGLRIARANHSCHPNASHYYDEINGLKILVSDRNIAAGDEICICYTNFGDVSADISGSDNREALERVWQIRCPQSCHCYSIENEQQIEIAKELDAAIMAYGRSGQIDLALEAGKNLLEYHVSHCTGHASLTRTYYDLFQICITQEITLEKGLEYLHQAYELCMQCTGTTSDSSLKYQTLLADPSQHNAFLIFENFDHGTNDVKSVT
jgi:endogenous inhibitor of DNA gyrase (YacG/DUF329 family)